MIDIQITKKQLLSASTMSKLTKTKGVLTKEEAIKTLPNGRVIFTISSMEDNVFFFTDDYCFGIGILPKHYVSSSTSIPITVKSREGLEDGIVDTVDKYISVFERDSRLIESIDVLLQVLNK